MKRKNGICVLVIFISIVALGLFRMNSISHNELMGGTPTMTGILTFYAYGIVAILISLVSLLIFKINSLKVSVFNKMVKVIFDAFILIITLPIIFIILFFYR